MKDYYKILQVDKDASPEIIKVAYKLLVKKYHPDLKDGDEKKQAEEKIKIINDAYDILSNPNKRAEYDSSLAKDFISQEKYQQILKENINLKKELNYFRNTYENNYTKPSYTNMYTNKNVYTRKTYSKQNNTSNESSYKNIFNINQLKQIFTEKIKAIVALIITFLLLFIILKIPYIKNALPNYINGEYLVILIFLIIGYIYFFKNQQ